MVVIATANLRIQVKQEEDVSIDANVKVYQTISGKQSFITSGVTDTQGMFYANDLNTPEKELSFRKNTQMKPYAQYHVEVSKNGYHTEVIRNIQVFEGNDSMITIQLKKASNNLIQRHIQNIKEHRLFEGEDYA